MKEVIENIFEVIDEYGSDLCDIDTLVRTDEKGGVFLSCADCIFKDTDKDLGVEIAGCPYECVGNEDILKWK